MISVYYNLTKYLYPTLCFLTLILFTLQQNSDNLKSEFKKGKQLKILVYSPSISWSHAKYLGRIADTLVDAGHEVHFLKYIMSPELKFKNETSKVDKIYIIEPNIENAAQLDIKNIPMIADSITSKRPLLTFLDHPALQFDPLMATACRDIIKQRKLLQKLTQEHFDVGITEMYDYTGVAVFHKIGIRTKISAYALPLFGYITSQFDIPTFPSFIPNLFAPLYVGFESSFISRLINFYNHFSAWIWLDNVYFRTQYPIIKEAFGQDFPNVKELVKNSSLVFINSNPFLETTRPISNKFIYIGGLANDQSEENKKLDQRTQLIMDQATEGAVLFSLGSLTETTRISKHMLDSIINSFKQFPQIHFLWKVDKDTIKNISKLTNVHVFEWLQQPAILAHPNLRAFITHCGQNSITESAIAGIPILGIPLFADQFYNADIAQKRGLGIQIDVNDLNGPNAENVLVEAIRSILYQPKYQQNAKIISKKLKLTPFSPTERLVKWVEFAAEFGDLPELNLPGEKEMNWFVYYSLDVILFSIIVLVILFWVTFKCFKWILSSTINWFTKTEGKETKLKQG
uniref:glucuronosyltransferase n=1 Tax=Meloidogyne incognita TaxID=6306 RepID=A0A914MFY3_MELIC